MEDSKQTDIYRRIGGEVQGKERLADLDLRTIFGQLIRLPETFKQDFAQVHLPVLLRKAGPAALEPLLCEHYRHYASVPCLAALLATLRGAADLGWGRELPRLLEHIRTLRLAPGPTAREREQYVALQHDLAVLENALRPAGPAPRLVDLGTPAARRRAAEVFHDRVMGSMLSPDEDRLVGEKDLVHALQARFLQDAAVQRFAERSLAGREGDRAAWLRELGGLLAAVIRDTGAEVCRGVMNGDRADVLGHLEEVLADLAQEAPDPARVDLAAATAAVVAAVQERVFNAGLAGFQASVAEDVWPALSGHPRDQAAGGGPGA